MSEITELDDIIRDVNGQLSGLFGQMEWSEEEISAAISRYPAEADSLYHSFGLLRPTHDLMATEFVYRSHCRELLDRAAAGEDTRPGTSAEVAIACCEASQLAPLTSPAAGLYMRMWARAFPEQELFGDSLEHHEALEGSRIDDLEREARRKLTVHARKLDEIECRGMHHGEMVQCKYSGGRSK